MRISDFPSPSLPLPLPIPLPFQGTRAVQKFVEEAVRRNRVDAIVEVRNEPNECTRFIFVMINIAPYHPSIWTQHLKDFSILCDEKFRPQYFS